MAAASRQGRRQITQAHSGVGPVIIPLQADGGNAIRSSRKKPLDVFKKKGKLKSPTASKFATVLHRALLVVAITGVVDFFAHNGMSLVVGNQQPTPTLTTYTRTTNTSIPPALMVARPQPKTNFQYYLGAVDPANVRIRSNFTANQQTQIDQFRNGNGLLLNVHVVHHGGTTFCFEIGGRLYAPSFACMSPKWPVDSVAEDYPERRPWSHPDTDTNIAAVRKSFNMISWEFSSPLGARLPQLEDTYWEHAQLVSVFVARHPMSRLLAGDATVKKRHPNLQVDKATVDDWWAFARDDRFTDNFCMRVFAGRECCQGNNTDPKFLSKAKSILERFTIILDVSCLDAGIAALGQTLGLNMNIPVKKQKILSGKRIRVDPKDKIPYPEIYQYLVQKNRLDIELYEWAKERSLVHCDEFWTAEKANFPQQQSMALP
jgi:hypothetical protein